MKQYLTPKNIIILIVTIIIVGSGLIFYKPQTIEANSNLTEEINMVSSEEEKENESFYVDVKGAVKKPGVYIFTNDQVINDAILAAGGLSKNASTKNINLSKKLVPEMVVYVFTTNELNKPKAKNQELNCPEVICQETSCEQVICPELSCPEINCPTIECNCGNQNNQDQGANDNIIEDKLNINTASLEELLTLPGIGEAKGKAIIEYRQENKFNNIEDLKNVSGIGETIFLKLKDLIKV